MSWVQFPSGAPIQLTLRSAECAGNGQGRFCGRSGEILGISKCREVNRPRESGLYSYVIFSCGVSLPKMRDFNAGMMELADVADSKSVGSNTVWVQVPLPAPNKENSVVSRVRRVEQRAHLRGGGEILWTVNAGR